MTVAIVRATMDTVDQAMATAMELLNYRPTKDAFFIKPNVADAGPVDQGVLTHPRVVEAFLKLYPDRKAVIGESGIVGRDSRAALEKTGYRELADRLGAELVDLEQAERFAVPWREGVIKLPTLIRTHEYVNIAKMKTHVQAGVTLGLKNQKGLLHFADKKRFHMTGLDACIRQLGEIAKPDLTIVDGIIALEGDGPWRFGTRKDANLLVAGADMVEVDNVCLRLMGFPPEHAGHIPHLDHVETVGLPLEEAITPFKYNYSGHFRYKNLYEHITDSCSGCNWTLYGTLKAVKQSRLRRLKFLYRGAWRRLDIVMGHGLGESLPEDHGKVVCVGDCTRRYAERHHLPVARGCPPDPDTVAGLF
jgi:uncharacterized protein (DUF362 family)